MQKLADSSVINGESVVSGTNFKDTNYYRFEPENTHVHFDDSSKS